MKDRALEGFQPYLVVAGSPSVSFSKNGVGVSKAAVAKLCNSRFVRVLIDAKGKRMAIQICAENDPLATPFAKSEKPEGIRWNTRDLNQTIQSITGWSFDEGNPCYRVEGTFVDDEDGAALVFDLNEAQLQT